MALCHTFRNLSCLTWMQLEKARSIEHQILEETITDLLMVELKYNHPFNVYTKTFTRREEGINGADWEWWFVDSSGIKGIGFRVQAKIINFKTDSFEQLYYKSKNATISQTDKLISDALKINPPLIPIYCLYVQYDDHISGIDFWESLIQYLIYNCSKEHFGCSILSAFKVKDLKKKNLKHIAKLANHLIPWHYLVCPRANAKENKSLTERVDEFVKIKNFAPETKDFVDSYLRDIPPHISNILNRSYNENEIEDNQFYREDLRGILVIQDKN